MSFQSLPIEEDNNVFDSNPQGSEDSRRQAIQDRMIEATFKLYRPETDAEVRTRCQIRLGTSSSHTIIYLLWLARDESVMDQTSTRRRSHA